jgi:hypothetical protein
MKMMKMDLKKYMKDMEKKGHINWNRRLSLITKIVVSHLIQ